MKISKSYSLLATLLMSLSLASCGGGTLKPLKAMLKQKAYEFGAPFE